MSASFDIPAITGCDGSVVTRITDVHLRKLTDYVGNYSKYVEQRDAMLEQLRQAKRDQDEEIARVKLFIDRFRYKATKAAQVQSRIKMLEKVVPIEVPPERKRIHFRFPACAKSGRTVLEVKQASKAYGALKVLDKIDLHIERATAVFDQATSSGYLEDTVATGAGGEVHLAAQLSLEPQLQFDMSVGIPKPLELGPYLPPDVNKMLGSKLSGNLRAFGHARTQRLDPLDLRLGRAHVTDSRGAAVPSRGRERGRYVALGVVGRAPCRPREGTAAPRAHDERKTPMHGRRGAAREVQRRRSGRGRWLWSWRR